MWRWRQSLRSLRWIALLSYLALHLVRERPAYYLMARIDLTGGSTGWHRARLIEVAFEQLGEWWLAGTDYTRHWMATGVGWSQAQTDIVNHYIFMGVVGGLPLMFRFIAVLVIGFSFVGRSLQRPAHQGRRDWQFMVWALGASLFAHCVTFISVSYFDQSFVLFYLVLAAIGSLACIYRSHPHAGPVRGMPGVEAPSTAWWAPESAEILTPHFLATCCHIDRNHLVQHGPGALASVRRGSQLAGCAGAAVAAMAHQCAECQGPFLPRVDAVVKAGSRRPAGSRVQA
jgi:hypothetical protein